MGSDQQNAHIMNQVDLFRRNSSLTFKKHGSIKCVEKRYHATFTALQEQESYECLARLVKDIPGVRTAYIVEASEDALVLEYIDGRNIFEEVLSRGVGILGEKRESLLLTFLAGRKDKLFFDFDPTNIIYSHGENKLVFIDPVCQPVILSEHAIVVFLWGLIKLFLLSKRPFRLKSFCRAWYLYYIEYLDKAGISYKTLNKQMCQYIDVVIGWNKKESKDEPLKLRVFRYIVIIPVYNLIKGLFRLNVIRAG